MLKPVALSNIKRLLSLLLKAIFFFGLFASCSSESNETTAVKVVELEKYKTIVSLEDNLLVTPTSLIYDGISSLFVYDLSESKVLELDIEENLVQEIDRSGRGPGEFRMLNNMFIQQDGLYFMDAGQFLIHKYNRDGEHIHSLDYGELGYISSTPMLPINTLI